MLETTQMFDPKILKEEPLLDSYYNETYIWVLPKDPQYAFAFFEIGEGTKQYLTQKFGDDFLEDNYLVLRIYQVDGHDNFDGFNYNHMFEIDDFIGDKVVLSAYDGELFGHWWEEGPSWIELVFRKMLYDQSTVRPVTPSEYLFQYRHHQKLMPGISTWGKEDYFSTWLEGREYQPNTWIYRHVFKILDRLINLASEKRSVQGMEKSALDQAAREMLLAQSSDWGFLIQTGQAVRYSEMRIVRHLNWAKELLGQVQAKEINQTLLESLEGANTIFAKDMDFRVFCRGL